jgi:xylan 1,4-beta-xylosidase
MSLSEPIIPGFFPDPSICRADHTYYVVNSSFEYLPGLPVHSSTDLVHWSALGNALERPSQIAEWDAGPSSGIYAPTIRHHDGRFFIVGTNDQDLFQGRGQFILTADDPAGPWSDPARVDAAIGIDPDLSWDEEGVCHLTWAAFAPDLRGIATVPIDPATGATLAEPRLLWQGTGGAHQEGPHLYRIDGWWYLLLAEGGTERGHSVTIARARTLDGPFESDPDNPILTHRGTAEPVQNTGHADLVQLADGGWAMVLLGVRPRGRTPHFHPNGRETFLVGIDWVDGWPVVDEDRYRPQAADHSFTDRFDGITLDPRWLGIGRFASAFTTPTDSGLSIVATGGRAVLATRVLDPEWTTEVLVDAAAGDARVVVRIDDAHAYGFTIKSGLVEAVLTIGPTTQVVRRMTVPTDTPTTLRISARLPEQGPFLPPTEPDLIELAVVHEDGSTEELGPFDGRYISTEVAGGFTGRVLAVEALTGHVVVHEVHYTTTTSS